MTRSKGYKMKKGKFRLDIRKKFFTLRVVHRLSMDIADAPTLTVFKGRLGGARSIFKGHSNPLRFYETHK